MPRSAADHHPLPFADFATGPPPQSVSRAAITAACRTPEPELVPHLLAEGRLPDKVAQAAQPLATRLATTLREERVAQGRSGRVQELLREFSLSSDEGVALMCLAEALLRIPDAATRDALIRDKIAQGDWRAHLGHSPSAFVNAATWGLQLTGRLFAAHDDSGLGHALERALAAGGEPLIRKGMDLAMRMMGEQFVTGRDMTEALDHAAKLEAQGFRFSYDMLGEAALTSDDAAHHFAAYETAIHAIGRAAAGRGPYAGPGISIKLSALHPRYSRQQYARVVAELYPRLLSLATLARGYDIGLNIDAEEADRLELSLDLLERLCVEPALAGWRGIGFVAQAYQKRCPAVIDHLVALARRSGQRLMLRLVKGAYWDSEIKLAQVQGLDDYPVYTRKAYTDLAYLACARRMLAAPDAIYPQFASHNAHTLAAVHELVGADAPPEAYEFQCLHGMGEPLYAQVVAAPADGGLGRPCRIYAPVGSHETLLAYLARRLLENGANTSFVHRIADEGVALAELVAEPADTVERFAADEGAIGLPHPRIALPRALYGEVRVNSRGVDLANEQCLATLGHNLRDSAAVLWRAGGEGRTRNITNPAERRDVVGTVCEADEAAVESALARATLAAPAWRARQPAQRATVLEAAADAMEAGIDRLAGLIVREAGRTVANAVAEVREAVDFLRYYAAQVRRDFDNATHVPLGTVACISPWNFPLAIFTGQVAAALAAGNTVLAKPAEPTPLIAAEAVRLLHAAGAPADALQLLPGAGEAVGAQLVNDARVAGVLFTGSTEVARSIARSLASRLDPRGRPPTLIAETGGINAMIVDSSALAEQVVADVLASAFDSAGQRCSALRLLCVQDEVYERTRAMLEGAMAELNVGPPERFDSDIGPLIDADAAAQVRSHIDAMRARGRRVVQAGRLGDTAQGAYLPPTLIELDAVEELACEVFGPVLHLVRYARHELDTLLATIDALGYGLTMGLHTRIDETAARIASKARVGNLYVNRNMVGAVVGVQPFGGEGLSGTGPKAGGPLYLLRLLGERPADLPALPGRDAGERAAREALLAPLAALRDWARSRGDDALAVQCARLAETSPAGTVRELTGPTGERNLWSLHGRERVLCIAGDAANRLFLLAAVLAAGAGSLWPADVAQALRAGLPEAVAARISGWSAGEAVGLVLHCGDEASLRATCADMAARDGAIVPVVTLAPGACELPLDRLMVERASSTNTAAAGGNATLMSLT